jgi:predicted dehydrogenase
MIRLALIGFGRQGRRYVETAKEMGLEDPRIGTDVAAGVIIATPPDSHVDLALPFLRAGLPVMIEKPVALSFDDAESLLPPQYENKILVNHTHLFAPAYERLKKLLVDPIIRIDISHHGPGPARDYSGLYDYGCHGVAMCLDLIPGVSMSVTAWKAADDLFDIRLGVSSGTGPQAYLRVGSGTTEKRCWMRVQTRRETGPISRRSGDVFEYNGLTGQLYVNGVVEELEDELTPLNKAIGVFVDMIQGKTDPRSGMRLPLQVMAVLDEANKSLGEANRTLAESATHAPLFDWEVFK